MMPYRTIRGAAVAAALAVSALMSVTASAAEPKLLGTFKDWNAFAFEEGGNKVCYMSSQPKKKEPAGAKRGEIYALVTHRPAEKSVDVVSFMMGYSPKKDVDTQVDASGKPFKLFNDKETAWARDADTDRNLVAAMRDGTKSMIVKGVSGRGTKTTDTYSLNGFGQAYSAISEACGVKR